MGITLFERSYSELRLRERITVVRFACIFCCDRYLLGFDNKLYVFCDHEGYVIVRICISKVFCSKTFRIGSDIGPIYSDRLVHIKLDLECILNTIHFILCRMRSICRIIAYGVSFYILLLPVVNLCRLITGYSNCDFSLGDLQFTIDGLYKIVAYLIVAFCIGCQARKSLSVDHSDHVRLCSVVCDR